MRRFYGPRIPVSANGTDCEIDFYAEGEYKQNKAIMIFEVRTKARPTDVEDVLDKIARFKKVFDGYSDRKILAALVWIRYADMTARRAWKEGIYTLRVSGEVMALSVPDNFSPRLF